MLNITGKYIKVWEVKIHPNMVTADLSSSKKNKDGEYENTNWMGVKFVGESKERATSLRKGDMIEIVSGMAGKRKYQDKWYDDVVVFDFNVMSKSESKPKAEVKSDDVGGFYDDHDENADLPF